MILKNLPVVMLVLLLMISTLASADSQNSSLPKADLEYLRGVYQDTFKGLDYFTAAESGFPYDVSNKKQETSISNIGLYMAAVAVAGKTGLISETQAVEKLERIFTTLEKIEKWNGFPVTWVDVKTGKQAYGSQFSYADHNGNLISGLLVVAGLYPEKFSARVDAFIAPMDFKSTYDPQAKMIKGGYDLAKKDFTVKQPWGNWYYSLLASDTLHFGLLGMATGQIPEDYWKTLIRHTNLSNPLDQQILTLLSKQAETKWQRYLWPGMEGGGLFMQYLPGIFLTEDQFPIAKSAWLLSRGQIELAKAEKYFPCWGISASETPDGSGYLGWAGLKKNVITPHASVLAIANFPKETIENLKALEAKGMRPETVIEGVNYRFGFTDSFDVVTGKVSEHYLALDQGMLFLSLANFLYADIVRQAFKSTKLGDKANEILRTLEKDKLQSGGRI